MEESKLPEIDNDYDVKTQRIFFVDEAHRSYNLHGEFFKNLMTCDRDGIYIAMTGTPLLTKKERSNLKFGDYIHKYFYDKSIADGYTLRIKKEQIDTTAKTQILENLSIEDKSLEAKDVYESNAYIDSVAKYISNDFKQFRFVNNDDTIGGMIVCRSNEQARMINNWFKNNSKLTSGLVMSDSENSATQSIINKNNQLSFKYNNYPDILVVHYMLTTGYDVKRLKKMYLLRGPHAQSLLQTISRVNRPYKNPDGKIYRYGYIVDFVDIEKEYNHTLDAYIKELEQDMKEDGDDECSLTGLIVDKENIKKKFDKVVEELKQYILEDNLETFNNHLDLFEKETLYRIRKLLIEVKNCSNEFKLSRADEYSKLIDDNKVQRYLKIVNYRINFINIKTNVINALEIMNNEQVVQVIYDFIKTKVIILDLSKFVPSGDENLKNVESLINELTTEIKNNKNKRDIKVQKLNELLKDIFNKLEFKSYSDINELEDELKNIIEEAKKINEENERLAKAYGGNFAFVKTLSDATIQTTIDRSKIEEFLKIVYENMKDTLNDDVLVMIGKQGFINTIKEKITKILLKQKLYSLFKEYYEDILEMLYSNLMIYKENI